MTLPQADAQNAHRHQTDAILWFTESMDKTEQSQSLRDRVMPPKDSGVSVVLNGVGNGMMLGAAPFMLLEMYSHITGKTPNKALYKGNAIATVAGCALGAWFGMEEAKHLREYRTRMGEEILKLHEENVQLKTQAESWAQKTQATSSEPETAPSR